MVLVRQLLEATWRKDCRSKATDFTRAGPLTPELLVTLLLFMAADAGRRGYSLMLDAFWEEASRSGIDLSREEPVTAAAFCKARRKLKPELLASFLAMVSNVLGDKHRDKLLWNGRRIFAVDGVRHNLQRSLELTEHFGVPHGGPCPQRLVSVLYDVILCDSPPLGAGIDPLVLATATGNLLLLLRTGVSHRDLTEAKLEVISRMPIRLLGAVLNDVPKDVVFSYYSYYLPGYETTDEVRGALPSGAKAT